MAYFAQGRRQAMEEVENNRITLAPPKRGFGEFF